MVYFYRYLVGFDQSPWVIYDVTIIPKGFGGTAFSKTRISTYQQYPDTSQFSTLRSVNITVYLIPTQKYLMPPHNGRLNQLNPILHHVQFLIEPLYQLWWSSTNWDIHQCFSLPSLFPIKMDISSYPKVEWTWISHGHVINVIISSHIWRFPNMGVPKMDGL